MKSRLEIRYDGEPLDVARADIRQAHEDGWRVVWNHKGLRGIIPPAVLVAIYSIVDAYRSNRRQRDAVPPALALVTWAQVVPIPGAGSHDPVRPDKGT